MKTLYKCEKCGKTFDDYDDCYRHESEHWTVLRGYTDLTDTLDGMTEYKEGQEEPNVVHLVMERWDAEQQQYVKRCGKYKLISSYEAPLVVTE